MFSAVSPKLSYNDPIYSVVCQTYIHTYMHTSCECSKIDAETDKTRLLYRATNLQEVNGARGKYDVEINEDCRYSMPYLTKACWVRSIRSGSKTLWYCLRRVFTSLSMIRYSYICIVGHGIQYQTMPTFCFWRLLMLAVL